MASIQVDMFEVQLGAGLLVQFRTAEGAVVRVLADAGVHASGYRDDHVLSKLAGAFEDFEPGSSRRLDLIIGTHYDADHLSGLVPILEDRSIDIGEVWLPPVANDVMYSDVYDAPGDDTLLARQFAGDDGEAILRAYLDTKAQVCDDLAQRERSLDERRDPAVMALRAVREVQFPEVHFQQLVEEGDLGACLGFFETHLRDCGCTLQEPAFDHADEDMAPPADFEPEETFAFPRHLDIKSLDSLVYPQVEGAFDLARLSSRAAADRNARVMAVLRRASAKDAINAMSLQAVTAAAKRRRLTVKCRYIDDGTPRRFVWKASRRRFVEGARLQAEGPAFDLLGPSRSLIKKHWRRLPVGTYAFAALARDIPIKSITPSNQLSYVVRFEQAGQGILIAGDAGCVDFKRTRTAYYESLLRKMNPLHVVQVAHHGGNNAHFYRVLLAAGYAEQEEPSWLLLSHATDDRYRPSDTFGRFIGQVRCEGDDVKLLFTSRPQKQKVDDYDDIIESQVGPRADRGDVRLSFAESGWQVNAHAVEV